MKTTENITEIDYSVFSHPLLARRVVEQMGGEESFLESYQNIVNHGINGGFSGFIYYSETCKFALDNIKLIRDLAKDHAEQLGIGMLEMIAGFNCLVSDYSQDEIGETLWGNAEDTQILNALAWYAGEEIAREWEAIIQD